MNIIQDQRSYVAIFLPVKYQWTQEKPSEDRSSFRMGKNLSETFASLRYALMPQTQIKLMLTSPCVDAPRLFLFVYLYARVHKSAYLLLIYDYDKHVTSVMPLIYHCD